MPEQNSYLLRGNIPRKMNKNIFHNILYRPQYTPFLCKIYRGTRFSNYFCAMIDSLNDIDT